MHEKELAQEWDFGQIHLETPEPKEAEHQRMLALMRGWWAGSSLKLMAETHGITRPRVHQLLASVGIKRPHATLATRFKQSNVRRARFKLIHYAQELVRHPCFKTLTAKQRNALYWQADGLVLDDIALRMGISAQAVQGLIAAARTKILRMEAQYRRRLELEWNRILKS